MNQYEIFTANSCLKIYVKMASNLHLYLSSGYLFYLSAEISFKKKILWKKSFYKNYLEIYYLVLIDWYIEININFNKTWINKIFS